MNPTLSGFISFAQDQGVTANVLPPDSQYFVWAYNVATATVNCGLQETCPPVYELAVYNLAMSNLLNFAPDGTGTDSGSTFFSTIRKQFGMLSMPTGLLQSASDEGTSSSYAVPEWSKTMTLGDLQLMKDPYGRRYIMFAQEYGTAWGLS